MELTRVQLQAHRELDGIHHEIRDGILHCAYGNGPSTISNYERNRDGSIRIGTATGLASCATCLRYLPDPSVGS